MVSKAESAGGGAIVYVDVYVFARAGVFPRQKQRNQHTR